MKVYSQIVGQSQAQPVELPAGSTIEDLRDELDISETYTAKVNGVDATDATELRDYAVVVWAEKVKGAKESFVPCIYEAEIYC